jgi:hypothetical protein
MENDQTTKMSECDLSDTEANMTAFKEAYKVVMDDDITEQEIDENSYKTELLDLCVQFAKFRLGLYKTED